MEAESETRHEYINGEIVPMAGAMPNHNRVTRNLCTTLTIELKGKPFEAFVADQRLWIPARQIYTYPDILVVAGELQFQEGRKDTIVNPLLIVEVLSESTEGYDPPKEVLCERGDKFVAYRTLPSFQEYVLVDQYSAHVEHYAKTGPKKWEFQEYDMESEAIFFASLKIEVSLTDIYEKVVFELIPEGEVESEVTGTDA